MNSIQQRDIVARLSTPDLIEFLEAASKDFRDSNLSVAADVVAEAVNRLKNRTVHIVEIIEDPDAAIVLQEVYASRAKAEARLEELEEEGDVRFGIQEVIE